MNTYIVDKLFTEVVENCQCRKLSFRDVVLIFFRLQVLRSDNLKLMERELFIYFFTDPPRLKRAIAELSARVDAQIVSSK